MLKLDMEYSYDESDDGARRYGEICSTLLSATGPWPATLTIMPVLPEPMVTL
jgi:hypothetical protein